VFFIEIFIVLDVQQLLVTVVVVLKVLFLVLQHCGVECLYHVLENIASVALQQFSLLFLRLFLFYYTFPFCVELR